MTDLAIIDTDQAAIDALLAEFQAATVEISLDDLNPTQRRAADRLIGSITFTDFEIKTLSVTRFDNRRSVTVYVETGLTGDEGTLASVFGRSKRHFTIGPRGAVKILSR
jgi:hypothetical protein